MISIKVFFLKKIVSLALPCNRQSEERVISITLNFFLFDKLKIKTVIKKNKTIVYFAEKQLTVHLMTVLM